MFRTSTPLRPPTAYCFYTTTVVETLAQAGENVAELIRTEEPSSKPKANLKGIEEVVGDKETLATLQSVEVRTYISEKKQLGRRHWEGKAEQQRATYAIGGASKEPVHGELRNWAKIKCFFGF